MNSLNDQIIFLIIDDDEDDRELFQIALESAGPSIKLIGAGGGHEALAKLKNKTIVPDYIFLDLNMPQMSGRECLSELKQHEELAGIPVVIFSTSSDPRDIKETRALGAIGFITKPPKTSELTSILSEFIANQVKKYEIKN